MPPKEASPPPSAPPPPTKFSLLPKVINGGIAGIIGVSVVFPLDLVKTRLQNQTIGPNGEKQYSSIFDCFKKTIASEGYLGMYRGSAVNIILVTPEKAIKLAANDMFRYYLTLPNGVLPISRQMVAGGLAGAFQIIITTPMELLKIQMQIAGRAASEAAKEGRTVERLTAMTLTKRLLAERGIFGLYKGITITAARDVSFSTIYFPLFAILAEQGIPPGASSPPFWWNFGSGCVAGSVAAWTVTPWDVLKTRVQAGSKERKAKTATQIFADTLRSEGVTAFFKGGVCRIMVIAPLFGVAQAVYYIGIAEHLFGL